VRVLRIACVALLALVPTPSRADESDAERSLRSAAALYENLEYERALEQLRRAKSLARTPEEDVKVLLYQGMVLSDLGRRKSATKAFQAAFNLDPDAKLPVQVSPKVQKLFDRTRTKVLRQIGPAGLRRLREARDTRVRATPAAAPPAPETPPVPEAPPTPETPPETPPPVAESAKPVAPTPPPKPDIRPWAWLPAAVGVAAAGGGTYLYFRARADYNTLAGGQLTPEQALAVRNTGQMRQTIGFALIGVGAAGVLAAGALALFGGPTPPAQPTAWVTPDGFGVGLTAQLP
jgi:tetratricopeptide (TPR) repeat protein